MNFPALYGILFTSICGWTVVCNLYTTRGDYKTPINRLFTALGLCLIFWSAGYTVALTAAAQAVSLVGRRISPIGWGMIYGVFLHYVLFLTGREDLLSRKWLYPALYLPGIATVAAFSLLPLFGLNEDRLVRTGFGWVNTAAADGWDIFFLLLRRTFHALCSRAAPGVGKKRHGSRAQAVADSSADNLPRRRARRLCRRPAAAFP